MDVKDRIRRRTTYLAIIGDVVGSRDLHDRGEVQQQLRMGISKVNKEFSTSIASDFILTIGDEFQGLLESVDAIPQLLAVLRSQIHPVEQRIGIGIGGLHTELEPVAIGMDGPCFHRARSAIERAKAFGTYLEVETKGVDEAFRIYALLYSGFRGQWTPRQRQVFDLSLSGYAGKTIARQLAITPSAVSQHLGAAGANIVFDATGFWVDALQRAFDSSE